MVDHGPGRGSLSLRPTLAQQAKLARSYRTWVAIILVRPVAIVLLLLLLLLLYTPLKVQVYKDS